jgi:hypothetical protein
MMREKVEREGVGWKGESSKSVHQGYLHRLDKVATSFFFTNFPEEVKAIDLWPRFAKYGRVGEVFIPAKVDKQGKRFGFVKYRDVSDAKELLRCISNIWIDSFKLRVNLSKFSRRSDSHGDVRREVPTTGKAIVRGIQKPLDGRSFKSALLEDQEERSKGGAMTEAVKPAVVPEVIWEVEVEEDRMMKLEGAYVGYLVEDRNIQTIQNNFRMDGFYGLNVTAMGHRMVLLWSDIGGEVKKVIENVGWWCSLFEKVIPWSPELVSNQRVVWLRCYGVPLHAWGKDLFRALAFKFGRFVAMDDTTRNFKRCDVARVKVLTAQKAIIDASMAVKVLGRRFDIRVIEELGGEDLEATTVARGGEDWKDDEASRVSGEGASFQAVVEGLSETGSDADISESCQVLLGLEAHGGYRTVTDGSIKEQTLCDENRAGIGSYILGKTTDVIEDLVNFDGDKEDCVLVESANTGHRVDGVVTDAMGGVHTEVVLVDDVAREALVRTDVGCGANGPAHVIIDSFDELVSKGGVKRVEIMWVGQRC